MSEEEKKALRHIKVNLHDEKKQHKHIYKYILGLYDNGSIEIILSLIDKQQKEIEEKEKVIDEMAKELVDLPIPISQEENVLFFNSFDVKKFFYKKIEKK